MKLLRLAGSGFRNLEPLELSVEGQFVVLSGRNAQGKTNLLEAIYLLATLKPLRARRIRDVVRWGENEAAIGADAEQGGLVRKYRVTLAEGRRTATIDGKAVGPGDGYFEGIRAIAFAPSDLGIVTSEPARRREWLDRAAFTSSPAHLEVVRAWRRLLDQKAAALRMDRVDPMLLDTLDEQLALESSRVVTRRSRLVLDLIPHVEAVHREVARQGQALSLRYRTRVGGETVEARAESLRAQLREARPRELERRLPLVGPQSDDVELLLDGRPARTFGSQGQMRTAVLALKLAELLAAKARGDVPLFLMDDVGSELDHERKERLVGLLFGVGAQVFATTTDKAHLGGLPREAAQYLRIEGGCVASDDP